MADAVILPGRRYGHEAPLLHYAGMLLERRGASVYRHEWSPDPPDTSDDVTVHHWVAEEARQPLDAAGSNAIIVGKSLGSFAAPMAADRSFPAVWLTPLLRFSPSTVDGLRRANAPYLLVGGTGDSAWDGDLARQLTPYVLEIPNADHGMEVDGPAAASIDVLRHVVVAIEEFLDAIGWPQHAPSPRD